MIDRFVAPAFELVAFVLDANVEDHVDDFNQALHVHIYHFVGKEQFALFKRQPLLSPQTKCEPT